MGVGARRKIDRGPWRGRETYRWRAWSGKLARIKISKLYSHSAERERTHFPNSCPKGRLTDQIVPASGGKNCGGFIHMYPSESCISAAARVWEFVNLSISYPACQLRERIYWFKKSVLHLSRKPSRFYVDVAGWRLLRTVVDVVANL